MFKYLNQERVSKISFYKFFGEIYKKKNKAIKHLLSPLNFENNRNLKRRKLQNNFKEIETEFSGFIYSSKVWPKGTKKNAAKRTSYRK